jgi:methionyl aminopeptidase
MKLHLKTETEIHLMKLSGELLSQLHGLISVNIKAGTNLLDLDRLAEDWILKNGGIPSFKNYKNYPFTLCISVNSEVVHGIPKDYYLKSGDIVSIDCGICLNNYHSDMAFTYWVDEIPQKTQDLLNTTKASLANGISSFKKGNRVGDISNSIQQTAQKRGYSIVRELSGHGIGTNLHEEPAVLNWGKKNTGPLLTNGMVLAIEPMINEGLKDILVESNGWTVRTKDRSLSAHYEHTVALWNNETIQLTNWNYIDKKFI